MTIGRVGKTPVSNSQTAAEEVAKPPADKSTAETKSNGWVATNEGKAAALDSTSSASSAGSPGPAEIWASWAVAQQQKIGSTGWLSRDDVAAETFDYIKTLSVPDRTALFSSAAGKDLLVTLAETMDDLDQGGDIVFDLDRIVETNQLIWETRFGDRKPRAPAAASANALADDGPALRARLEAAPGWSLVLPEARKTLTLAWDKAGNLEPRLARAVRSELVLFLEDSALSPETRHRATATLLRNDTLDVESALILLPALRAPLILEAQRNAPDPVRLDAVKAWEEFTARDLVNRPFLFVESTGGKGSATPGELDDISQSFAVAIWDELGLDENDFADLPPATQARLFEAAYREGLKRLEAGLARAKAAGKEDLLPSRAHTYLDATKRHPARAEIMARGVSGYIADARRRSEASYSVETTTGKVALGLGVAAGVVSPLIALGAVATGAIAGNMNWAGFTRLQQSRADAYVETYRYLFEQQR